MSFSNNKKYWTEFISLYGDQRALWDVKGKEYSIKHIKKKSLRGSIISTGTKKGGSIEEYNR